MHPAYLAGLIDADGSIYPLRVGNLFYPIIALKLSQAYMIPRILKEFPGANVQYDKKHKRAPYIINYQRKEVLRALIVSLQPYILIKTRQLNLALLMLDNPDNSGVYADQLRFINTTPAPCPETSMSSL